MSKSRDAFRTISEVSDWLDTPAHVLRFWESKFSQIKPVKRAGGRRYYRPQDMELLGGIKKLLHDDGMTIKGVQKLLREKGIKHVAAMGLSLDDALEAEKAVETAPRTAASDPAPADPAPDTEQNPAPVDIIPEHVDPPVSGSEPEEAPTPAATTGLPDQSDNVVPLTTAEPSTPAEEEPEATDTDAPPAVPEDGPSADAAALLAALPADPSDSSSRAPARLLDLLPRLRDPEAQLAARAAEIAPLLDRMQALRDRIPPR